MQVKPLHSGELLTMLHETLRVVLLETADAYRSLTEDDVPGALEHLKQVLLHAQTTLATSNQPSADDVRKAGRLSAFTIPDRPEGWSSVAGYLLRADLYDWKTADYDIVAASLNDGRTVMEYAQQYGIEVKRARAPQAYQDLGIGEIAIYPEDTLRAVFGR